MKQHLYFISLLLILSAIPFKASAVTEKEMEQARTIATQAYLRYANDGSGYLDEIHPTTMAELEKKLKPKEKENLKAFKAIPVPQGFQSWDKQKLIEYWGVQAFASKGLVEKGRIGRNRAKKNISRMNVSAPVKEPTKPAADKPASAPAPQAAATPKDQQVAPPAPQSPAQAAVQGNLSDNPSPADSVAIAEQDALAALDDFEEPQIKKADNHTWVYIVILVVLVGIVVALVVFASNVMKKNGVSPNPAKESDSAQLPRVDGTEANALREKFAASLNAKNEEIRALSKKIESLNTQNAALKNNLEALTAETASLRTRLTEATKALSAIQAAAMAPQAVTQPASPAPQPVPQTPVPPAPVQPAPVAEQPQSVRQPSPAATPAPQTPLRTIFLGRANAKGIFVRADRSLNIGNSVFQLDTTDGYAGSFRVANDPTVWEMAILMPREALSGACVVADIDSTEGMTKVVNDSAGTAIFDGGCWKVIRKAKVHYE